LKPLKFNFKITKRNILYSAYIAGITIFFLYALFPSDTVKKYLVYRLRQGYPNVTVTIERANPILPPGIKLHHLRVSYLNSELFQFENVKVRPRLLSLFGPKTAVTYAATGYGGKLRGTAENDDTKPGHGINIDGQVVGIEVQRISALQQLSAHKISGTLGGIYNLTQIGPNRSLTGKLSVSDCRIEFAAPVFLQESLTFREISADLILNDRSVTIKNGTLNGNDLDARVSGTIGWSSGAGPNTLDLIGTMALHHTLLAKIEKNLPPNFGQALRAGKNAVPFKIGGTFKDPSFSFN
jgi:type II secretion system protein N